MTPASSITSAATASREPRVVDDLDVPRSIGRVLDLFEIVLAQGRCNLTTAAATAGLTPTTALRYLRALETRGYLDRDSSGDFSAGPTALRLAAGLRGGTILDRLISTAQPHLDRLADRTGESAYLAVSDGRTGTYVATAESSRAIRHVGWIGQQVPLEGSALGAALARPGTVVTRTGAVEPDITAMSRALNTTGSLDVAVSIVGPDHRFTEDRRTHHQRALGDAVDELERELLVNGEDFTS
jgi:DNA-binding IclR family transcriptional regulator